MRYGWCRSELGIVSLKQPILEVDASFLPLAARTAPARASAAERQERRYSIHSSFFLENVTTNFFIFKFIIKIDLNFL